MTKSSNKTQIAIDKSNNLVYNTSMKNNNNTNNNSFSKGTQTMMTMTHDVRVIKHIDGSYDTFANFTTVKEAVEYMRNWDANAMQCWYIIDANDNRLRMNDQGKLVVFNSLIGY